jgi:triacylglycerol lipase
MKTISKMAIMGVIASFLLLATAPVAMSGSNNNDEKTYCKTRYPIILVHGVCGFDKIAGVVEYWYGIPSKLMDDGATVRSAKLSAQSNNDLRAQQLIQQIEAYLADTGASKVNIIAHSHGSTTSRQAMHMRPDLVASLTTIAGPHKGSPVADFANEEIPPSIQGIGYAAGDLLGLIIDLFSGFDNLDQDTAGLVEHFTKEGIAAFNAKYPCKGVPESDDTNARGADRETFVRDGSAHTVRYYSWTGRSQLTNVLDALDYLWPVLHLINKHYGIQEDDGFVGVTGSHLGVVISDAYEWNHADEVNHLLGIRKPFSVDPRNVIREHANRLKNAGL